MQNLNSRLNRYGRPVHTALTRAMWISLALHIVLLLQALPAATTGSFKRDASTATHSIDATLRGEKVSIETVPNQRVPSILPAKSVSARRVVPRAAQPGDLSGPARPSGLDVRSRQDSARVIEEPQVFGDDRLDAGDLRQYRLSVAVASRRFKDYPPEALAKGWTGTAEVRITVTTDGLLGRPLLLTSSGHELLDRSALTMIGSAAEQVALPPGLRNRAFSVSLPVAFSLEDE